MENVNTNNMYSYNAEASGVGTPQTVMPVNYQKPMTVTSIVDLQKYANGTVVRFPDFAEGQPFVARVRRPSLLVLAKEGKIPNSLLTTAGELFSGSTADSVNENTLRDMYDVCHIVCEATLIEPTLRDIESQGINLSDEQLMAIFNYTQAGIKSLEPFREE